MTTTVKKTYAGIDQFKAIQTEDLAYYQSEGWVETNEAPSAPVFKKAKRRVEEPVEEVKEEE